MWNKFFYLSSYHVIDSLVPDDEKSSKLNPVSSPTTEGQWAAVVGRIIDIIIIIKPGRRGPG